MRAASTFPHIAFQRPTYRSVLSRQFTDAFDALSDLLSAGALVAAIAVLCLAIGGGA